jgi:DNA invertase Pin-like site-specific DNA recombinase
MQLIEDAHENDVILVEQIDRLKHLNPRVLDGRE